MSKILEVIFDYSYLVPRCRINGSILQSVELSRITASLTKKISITRVNQPIWRHVGLLVSTCVVLVETNQPDHVEMVRTTLRRPAEAHE